MSSSTSCIGVLMLYTRFPRPPGDIGNPESFTVPVLFEQVAEANVHSVVLGGVLTPGVVEAFVAGARCLQRRGATFITTSCGFLGPAQGPLSDAVDVPVATTSLMLLPLIRARLGASAIGILTFDADHLDTRHLEPWDADPVVVEGLRPTGELHRAIAQDRTEIDYGLAENDCRAAAERLKARVPGLKAVVLECTNLTPYRVSIAKTVGCPVYDVHSLIHHYANVTPRDMEGFAKVS